MCIKVGGWGRREGRERLTAGVFADEFHLRDAIDAYDADAVRWF